MHKNILCDEKWHSDVEENYILWDNMTKWLHAPVVVTRVKASTITSKT